jgi:hypothetical protein
MKRILILLSLFCFNAGGEEPTDLARTAAQALNLLDSFDEVYAVSRSRLYTVGNRKILILKRHPGGTMDFSSLQTPVEVLPSGKFSILDFELPKGFNNKNDFEGADFDVKNNQLLANAYYGRFVWEIGKDRIKLLSEVKKAPYPNDPKETLDEMVGEWHFNGHTLIIKKEGDAAVVLLPDMNISAKIKTYEDWLIEWRDKLLEWQANLDEESLKSRLLNLPGLSLKGSLDVKALDQFLREELNKMDSGFIGGKELLRIYLEKLASGKEDFYPLDIYKNCEIFSASYVLSDGQEAGMQFDLLRREGLPNRLRVRTWLKGDMPWFARDDRVDGIYSVPPYNMGIAVEWDTEKSLFKINNDSIKIAQGETLKSHVMSLFPGHYHEKSLGHDYFIEKGVLFHNKKPLYDLKESLDILEQEEPGKGYFKFTFKIRNIIGPYISFSVSTDYYISGTSHPTEEEKLIFLNAETGQKVALHNIVQEKSLIQAFKDFIRSADKSKFANIQSVWPSVKDALTLPKFIKAFDKACENQEIGVGFGGEISQFFIKKYDKDKGTVDVFIKVPAKCHATHADELNFLIEVNPTDDFQKKVWNLDEVILE